MNTLRWDRVDTVGSTVLQWIVQCFRQCNVSSTGDVANRSSMRADNIHGTQIFPQNADNIHGTWIFPRNADTQNTVESSIFGSKFIALRIATEMIKGLRYKLRMFGVSINGPAGVFCSNQLVVTNVSIPSYFLNKKHNSLCYHRFREAHTTGTMQVGWISGEYNKADIGTKTTIHTKRRYKLLNLIFNQKVSTITKKSHGDDGEMWVPSLIEVSKYLLYGKKLSLKAGSEYDF